MTASTEGPTPVAVSAERHEVFPVPVWTVDCAPLRWAREDLVREVDRELAVHQVQDVIGQMTRNELHRLPGAVWEAYRTLVESVCDSIAQSFSPPWTDRRIATWGIKYTASSEFVDEARALHSHARATLTCALFLSVPSTPDGGSAGALVLRNPWNHLLRRYGMDTYVHVPAVEMLMAVFPGFVEHFPEPPSVEGPLDPPRTLLVTDVHYY